MSKNDKRELIDWDLTDWSKNHTDIEPSPQYTFEFGLYHEMCLARFHYLLTTFSNINQIAEEQEAARFFKKSTEMISNELIEPVIALFWTFDNARQEYAACLAHKEDFEKRINTAIDNIERLQSGVDKTISAELEKIKQNLWRTGQERGFEYLWNVERRANEISRNNQQNTEESNALARWEKLYIHKRIPLLYRLLAALKCSK